MHDASPASGAAEPSSPLSLPSCWSALVSFICWLRLPSAPLFSSSSSQRESGDAQSSIGDLTAGDRTREPTRPSSAGVSSSPRRRRLGSFSSLLVRNSTLPLMSIPSAVDSAFTFRFVYLWRRVLGEKYVSFKFQATQRNTYHKFEIFHIKKTKKSQNRTSILSSTNNMKQTGRYLSFDIEIVKVVYIYIACSIFRFVAV